MTPSPWRRLHQRPHVAPQIDVDAGRRLVEEQDLRLMGEGLGDHHPPLHAPRKLDDPARALLPQREIAQEPFDEGRVRGPAEEAPAERRRRLDGGKNVEGDLLRHEADLGASRAIVADHVMAVDKNVARTHRDRAADRADQRRLAGAVRSQKREDLPLLDGEIDRIERQKSGRIAFGDGGDGDHRRHGDVWRLGRIGRPM